MLLSIMSWPKGMCFSFLSSHTTTLSYRQPTIALPPPFILPSLPAPLTHLLELHRLELADVTAIVLATPMFLHVLLHLCLARPVLACGGKGCQGY